MTKVSIAELVAGARAGKAICFPTDTVPALATLPENASLIFTLKQRDVNKPLILMGSDAEQLWSFVYGSQEEYEIWQNIADKYWGGALTLVLPASTKVPQAMNPNDPTTIGVRVPQNDIARAILAQTGPLATTSANLSGQPALQTMDEIELEFPDVLTLATTAYDSKTPAMGIPSTVAKWNGGKWQILRQGAVNLEI
ncbi:MAG: L-threonylcarbamoyladenylate synthase [Richelia sp. RM2_1_2]|nr:L-threonylcarbamoyladenylate synthase [Richelia sp. SM2_1_7]NJM19477.1 L-threonylcarbamoyladenylate synthase [Richelia sp. SM1_7_0]NJN08116.1 L-threonylcarbamoyladenylate synthase [Richelia sp. RM1_1_1]NJO28841.1 L-threonylcarbamoyladenylate synthase [Richelia sp. SL_2_1]NJO60853.1 L-threonylcarbamoyladenylate synthase [Richelia sp. RM2_1_2]